MSTQELLTYLFDAIALGFIVVAAMDFTSRLIVLYQQVSMASSSSKKELANQQSTSGLSSIATPEKLPPLPDPWLLPSSSTEESVVLVKVVQKEQKHLKLLLPAKEIGMAVAPKPEDLLQGISIDKLKLRQARKIAKVLGIAQKVKGRDQKLAFLVNQIKLKLQQPKLEVTELVRQELLACQAN